MAGDTGEARIVRVAAARLTAEAWAPFGALPVDETDPADPVRIEFEWGDPHVNYISHRADEVERSQRGLRCDRMYRHDTHTQTLMPLNCDSVLAVAPAEVDFSDPSHLTSIRAFMLRPLDCFVLARGTWHWGPFPTGPEPVRLLNLQGRRYAEDNASVDLTPVTGATVEIAL
ncbi:MAG: ureidoglycolate lyase [Acidimicrobiia bacterium]